jgi:nucleotide-binding universal stress UspA family protein
MKTLLVPLDFSDVSETVLASAGNLAVPLGAKIVLLHIVEPIATYVPVGASMDVMAAAPPPLETEDIKVPQQRLEKLAEPLRAQGAEVEAVSLVGLAVDDILAEAESRKVDVIVLGSHGHGALYHLFSGSVVTGVLKRSSCPVLVVPTKKSK